MYFLKKYRRGIFNKYSINKKLIEIFFKDVSFFIKKIYFFFKNGFKHKTILVFPHYPGRTAGLFQLTKGLNYNLTNKINSHFDIAIYWEYATFRKEYYELEKIAEQKKVINLYNRDISKKKVDEVFSYVFGYSSLINPLKFEGKCVMKSYINGKHDGKIINCPVNKIEEGFIYQKLIDTINDEGLTEEIRVGMINFKIVFALLKLKKPDNRFGFGYYKSEIIKPKDFFSEQELDLIINFCKEFKFEFGELDILRDKNNGKIYIVDANNTPQQAFKKDKKKKKLVHQSLSTIFKNEYLS